MGLFNKNGRDFKKEDLYKFSLFMMELLFKIHNSKDETQNNEILNILLKMRDYEVREMVVLELKVYSYQQRTSNSHEVDNSLLLSKIEDMIINLDAYKNKYMTNKYSN